MKKRIIDISVAGILLLLANACQEVEKIASTPIPTLEKHTSGYTLYVYGQPFTILGGQCGNSSNWPATLPQVWETMRGMNANTLEIPVYWEEIEAKEGEYDFSSVQLLLDQARNEDMRLVLLWFATWKNGSNHYTPEWFKQDSGQYFNTVGKDGQQVDSPSPHCKAAMEKDAAAFRELMKYLKENDPCHTVIMVQVENEPGTWGSVRDYSRSNDKLFSENVPDALLKPEILKELGAKAESGNWKAVFGERADEYFNAWHIASYIEYVAAAGKEVNPLPLYVNAALRDPLSNPPATEYESGGPTDNVIAIYKAAAPHIDICAPDIYLQGDANVLTVINLYDREDNALFVPETGGNVKYLYEVLTKGIGFSPFGVDGRMNEESPLSKEYKLLKPITGKLAEWQKEGMLYSATEPEGEYVKELDLGEWKAIMTFGKSRRSNSIPTGERKGSGSQSTGKAFFVKFAEGDFLAMGTNVRFTFEPSGKNAGRAWHYLRVEEGCFNENGEWVMRRVLNGDQTDWGGPFIGDEPGMLRIRVYSREPRN